MVGNISFTSNQPQKNTKTLVILRNTSTQKPLTFFDKETNKRIQARLDLRSFKGEEGQMVSLENIGGYELLLFVGMGSNIKHAVASAIRMVANQKQTSVGLSFDFPLPKDMVSLGRALTTGFYMGNYQFLKYKSKKEQKERGAIVNLTVYLPGSSVALKEVQQGAKMGQLVGEGMALTRDLVNEPASHLSPQDLAKQAFAIEKESKGRVSVEVFDRKACERLGMGSFLGVAQGSDREPAFIVLTYKPKKRPSPKAPRVCFVGKSIIFDSGGLSLKPAEHMEDMKIDMAGGATVLGAFHVLSQLDLPLEAFGILPACENMPSGKALRPGDIVTAMNGKTIEVLNTDAEGRLTLADALVYAEEKLKATHIVDLATLTGACMVALGSDLTGFFSNNQQFGNRYEKIANEEGDELWGLPLYKPYAKKMKSDIADLKNIGGGRYAGAITAALFLSEFVNKAQWIHLDIAGPAYRSDEPRGMWTKGATGWGVASLVSLLESLSF